MKHCFYILCFISLLLISKQAIAQTCSSEFTINTKITNSTCLSNGEIEVTLSGELDNLFNFQYGLSSTNGFNINPQANNVLKNIPPGTYQLTVRAFCEIDNNYDVVKSVANLVVGGTYKVPQVSFNANISRKSYAECPTGIIALNVTDGSGNFTFTITSAPSGVTTPSVVVPTKSGNVYTLPGQNYPAGDYTIQVSDGCYTASRDFTLGTVSGFPSFTTETYSSFRPDLDNTQGSCSYVKWVSSSSQLTTNADYQRYYKDNMYEIGAAPVGEMPQNWTSWDNTSLVLLNLSPYNISNFYTPNRIAIYTRLKGCSTAYRSFNTYIYKPVISGSNTYYCDNYTRAIYPWTDDWGILCYPLTLTVKNYSSGEVIYSKSNWLYSTNWNNRLTLEYGKIYTVTFVDQNGTTISNNIQTSSTRTLYLGGNNTSCDSYTFSYYISTQGKPFSCWDWPARITITDPDGVVIARDSVTTSITGSKLTPPLEYGKTYTVKVVYPDSTSYTTTRNVASGLPTVYSLSTVSSLDNKCFQDWGTLYVSANKVWPVGTKLTVTGPSGYTSQSYTAATSSSGYYMSSTHLPPGTYTLTADHGCGTPIVTTFNNPGIYNYKDLGYSSEITCSGLKITPKGNITYKGNAIANTYFRILSGPTGYDTNVISAGESYVVSEPGTYTIGILVDKSTTACAIGSTSITYTTTPLNFDPYATSAYVCVGETIGNISLKAINGVAPYTYELWDKTNTVKENIESITTDGIAHFAYGAGNQTYTARISDQCGNSFNQQVTLAKLSEARIVYSNKNTLCYGDTLKLHCITLGQTTYHWTGPNNYSVTEQNPTITSTNEKMTGWYKVSVTPEFCGVPVEDSIYIRVYPLLTPATVTGSQTTCVRTQPSAMDNQTTGGSGTYTYQWQSSANGTTGWTNISGATGATYTPPSQIKSGTFYYRRITTDLCGTVQTDPITLVIKPCYIPVNPSLQSKTKK